MTQNTLESLVKLVLVKTQSKSPLENLFKTYLFIRIESIQQKKFHNVVHLVNISIDLEKIIFSVEKIQLHEELTPNIII